MEHELRDTISLLARTPVALSALLRDLPDAWTLRNEGENTWSAFDIVGHLIHAERTDLDTASEDRAAIWRDSSVRAL